MLTVWETGPLESFDWLALILSALRRTNRGLAPSGYDTPVVQAPPAR